MKYSGRAALRAHAQRLGKHTLQDLAVRRINTCFRSGQWQLSLARQYLDPQAERALLTFGMEKDLESAITSLFAGEMLNLSEGRAALHWALRWKPDDLSGEARQVRESLNAALELAHRIRAGEYKTISGTPFSAIIHIGIGGSDWGPRLLENAFALAWDKRFPIRFCSGSDLPDWQRAISGLSPESTLIIGASKSFKTKETLHNLQQARSWLESVAKNGWATHMVLASGHPERVRQWLSGAQGAHILSIPETVGGRYSLWSAVSIAVMIGLGPEQFGHILTGARHMDEHVRTTPLSKNLAMQLALLDYWNATIRLQPMRVVLVYANCLRLLPAWLQQLEMESNGKSVTPQGNEASHPGAPAVWGGEGHSGEHSFCQWLHQSHHAIPAEFIVADTKSPENHQNISTSLAHALAQAETLCNGRSMAEVLQDNPDMTPALAQQKLLPGGRPSTILYTPALTAESLGQLLALYEHRTYLAGQLWNVNSFDQWGVEQGKTLTQHLQNSSPKDPVTKGLIKYFS